MVKMMVITKDIPNKKKKTKNRSITYNSKTSIFRIVLRSKTLIISIIIIIKQKPFNNRMHDTRKIHIIFAIIL